MPNAMTSRERVLAAIRREPVDYVPCCASFNPLTPVQCKGHKWQFPWPPDASGEEQIRYQVEGVMPILDYLANLTVDSLFGIDIAFKGMDLSALRDKLSPTKSLWTGPSSTYHLWQGPDVTRQAVRNVFEVFGKTGLILSPCVSAHSIMPWESTLAMLDEWRKLR